MGSVNYMQRVGHSSCIRCDFETSDEMSFEEQDAALMAHLAEKHPDWMTDGATLKKPEPCPSYNGNGGYDNTSARRGHSSAFQALEEFANFRKAGSTVHAPGCECGFCKFGDTKGSSSMSWSNSQ